MLGTAHAAAKFAEELELKRREKLKKKKQQLLKEQRKKAGNGEDGSSVASASSKASSRASSKTSKETKQEEPSKNPKKKSLARRFFSKSSKTHESIEATTDSTPPSVPPSPPEPKTDTEKVLERLKVAIDRNDNREEEIEKRMFAVFEAAKKRQAKGDQRGALVLMKQKKMYDQEIDKIHNMKIVLMSQMFNLESAIENAKTVADLRASSERMKEMRMDVGVEKIDTLMADLQDELEVGLQMNQILTEDLSPIPYDEAELLAELDGFTGGPQGIREGPVFPDVPLSNPAQTPRPSMSSVSTARSSSKSTKPSRSKKSPSRRAQPA